MSRMINICFICNGHVSDHAYKLYCSICKKMFHLKCITLNKKDMDDLSQIDDWTCTLCLQEIFPFHTIEDNDEFIAQTQGSHGTMDLFDNDNNVFFEPLELTRK